MALRPVFTTFDRAVVPTNLLTVADWRQFDAATTTWQRQFTQRGIAGWDKAAKCYALAHGGALVWRADDSLIAYTRTGNRVRRTTYKPGMWGWA